MKTIPHKSTGLITYVADEVLTTLTVVAYDVSNADAVVTLANVPVNSGDGLTWTLTTVSTEFESRWHLIRLEWVLGDGSASVNDTEWAEVRPSGWPETLVAMQQVKDYLRVTGTTWDQEIADLILEAQQDVASEIGRKIFAAAVTERHGVRQNTRAFRLYNWPVSSSASLAILDPEGNDVTSSVVIHYDEGMVKTTSNMALGEWVVTYTGGMDQLDEWSSVQTVLAGCVRDLAAEYFNNRNPGASSVKDGDQGIVSFSPVVGGGTMPPRVLNRLRRFKGL